MAYKKSNANGQATMANSEPVVLASDQSDVKITLDGETIAGTVTANAGTNLNTSALALETGGNLASIKTNTDKIPALGQALAAASVPVVLTEAQVTTLTPPAAITGFATAANQLPDGHNVTVDNGAGASAVNIQDGGNSITVDGTVGVSGTVTVDLGANNDVTVTSGTVTANLAAGTNNIGDVDVLTMPGTGTEDAPETAGGTLLMAGTVRRDTAASSAGTTGDNATLNTDSLGRLWVSGAAVEDAAETAGGILLMAGSVRRDTAASSAGTTGDNATINTDSVGALWTRDTATQVDDAAFTPATGRVMPVACLADEASTDSVDEGDAGIPRMTLDRKQIVTPQAHTNGGATPYKLISAASTNATSVKGSAGQIYSIVAMNINAAVRYLKLYNKATAPTVGTDTPVQVYAIPGATTGGGFTLNIPVGMEFTTGIAFAITTGIADSDTGAVAASEIVVNLTYK